MLSYDELINKYQKLVTGAQRRALRRRAETLSLRNGEQRRQLAVSSAENVRTANARLAELGLASQLYEKPSGGEDAGARREDGLYNANAALRAGETAALRRAMAAAAQATRRAREKKERHTVMTPAPTGDGSGAHTRRLIVRKA